MQDHLLVGLIVNPLFEFSRDAHPQRKRLYNRVLRNDGSVPATNIHDIIRMVAGIAKMPAAEPGEIDRVLNLALDGLRSRS